MDPAQSTPTNIQDAEAYPAEASPASVLVGADNREVEMPTMLRRFLDGETPIGESKSSAHRLSAARRWVSWSLLRATWPRGISAPTTCYCEPALAFNWSHDTYQVQ